MAINPTSPIAGTPQPLFTSPTYTIVADASPNPYSEQVAVTALGGTQANVTTHSVSAPFTTCAFRPQSFRMPPSVNPNTGLPTAVPGNNVWKFLTRKGVQVVSGVNVFYVATAETKLTLPAGCETADAPNVKAMLSCHFGYVNQQSAGIGESVTTGII